MPSLYGRGTQCCWGKVTNTCAPYQYPGTLEWKTHTIPHSFQYHITYHCMSPYTDLIPYNQGCLGSFLQNMKSISAGCNTCPFHLLWTGSSDFCCNFKLQVEAIGSLITAPIPVEFQSVLQIPVKFRQNLPVKISLLPRNGVIPVFTPESSDWNGAKKCQIWKVCIFT